VAGAGQEEVREVGLHSRFPLLAPSTVMVRAPLVAVTVLGQGFTQQSEVLIDGQPSLNVVFIDSWALQSVISMAMASRMS
jgi:hypothetical protein